MRRMSDSEARIACFLVAKRRRSNQKVAHKNIGKSFIMKILEIDYTTKLNFEYPVYDHYFLLRSVPVSKDAQTVVSTNLSIFPVVTLVTSSDIFGNVSYQGRICGAHQEFSFHSTATVIVDRKNGSRDLCFPLYKYNTELTRCSPAMRNFLYSLFAGTDLDEKIRTKNVSVKDFHLVTEIIQNAIHEKIKYENGSTNVKTTAAQAFELQKGVCQDYSHIFCSLCREAGIPSRYVAGTSQGEGVTHAWSEYFIPDDGEISHNGKTMNGRWFGVDCTRNKTVDDTYVILALGRDYLDCKVDGGIFRGNGTQTMTVFVKTQEKKVEPGLSSQNEKNYKTFDLRANDFNIEEYKQYKKEQNQQQQM